MYFTRFINTVFNKAFYIIRSRKKEIIWATDYVKKIEQSFHGKFDDATFKKIVNSYAIYNPMMCDAFTLLHGRLTNKEERERMLHYFICSSLFDNFCDRKELKKDELLAISFRPQYYQTKNFDEAVFLASHLKLKNYVKDQAYYDEVTHKLYNAQIDSARQFDGNISEDELKHITFSKGGYSVLLCSFYLDVDTSEAEKQCWYRIGSIIQLTNDLFDIYKDLQDGSETLATRMQNAYAFEQFFLRLTDDVKKEINLIECPISEKQNFKISMMGICAFGLIALQQLKQLQGTALALPDFKEVPRKDLIVDMEKSKNLWLWIKLVYHHSKQ